MKNIINELRSGRLDATLLPLYGAHIDARRERLVSLCGAYSEYFGESDDLSLFSVPGRSELSGNHTDHNRGRVIAASIDLDIIAAATPRADGIIRLKSEGFPEDTVNINEYTAPRESDFGRSSALIAGMVAGFRKKGYAVGGFDAYTTSNVLKGSGLSSSAAFEVMIGNILNHLYNDGKIDNVEIAKLAQFSENEFFGKPCGLMDQMACAVGGIVAIDFEDTAAPVIEKVSFDFDGAGYKLCILDTGGNHADLTPDYAAVPAEMKSVAAALGKTVLRELDETELLAALPSLREKVGDRAVLRALHFFAENRRVTLQASCLREGRLDDFLAEVKKSGLSSYCYLQNVFTTRNVAEQGISLALCLIERELSDKKGAWRVHGGGFAGTVQAYVPDSFVKEYAERLEAVFGEGSCYVLRIRPEGAVRLA